MSALANSGSTLMLVPLAGVSLIQLYVAVQSERSPLVFTRMQFEILGFAPAVHVTP